MKITKELIKEITNHGGQVYMSDYVDPDRKYDLNMDTLKTVFDDLDTIRSRKHFKCIYPMSRYEFNYLSFNPRSMKHDDVYIYFNKLDTNNRFVKRICELIDIYYEEGTAKMLLESQLPYHLRYDHLVGDFVLSNVDKNIHCTTCIMALLSFYYRRYFDITTIIYFIDSDTKYDSYYTFGPKGLDVVYLPETKICHRAFLECSDTTVMNSGYDISDINDIVVLPNEDDSIAIERPSLMSPARRPYIIFDI